MQEIVLEWKKEIDGNTAKYIRNPFRLKVIKIEEEKNYYKPLTVDKVWSIIFIGYESKGDRKKPLSLEEYPNKFTPYLKDIINDLTKSDSWKIQLTLAINFVFARDNDEERVILSKSNIKEIVINDKGDKVFGKSFKSLLTDSKVDWKHQ